MKHFVIGTAGHIDHGKTSLVQALTGVDTDRLKEEKQRGITIELGFAELCLHEDIRCGIVDVPGHERFVKTMVAGVSGIDVVMLVISAEEGVKPQTREHLDIVQLLGVARGVVVLTKTDLVSQERLADVTGEARGFLQKSFLENAPIIAVSARTGLGLDMLKETLLGMLGQATPRGELGIARLAVDRVFSVAGFGTVVTGTVAAGSLLVADDIQIMPTMERGRIRGVQVHGAAVSRVGAGQRAAINIQGIDYRQIQRGMVLVRPDTVSPTRRADVVLQVSALADHPLQHRSILHFHSGTSECMATVIILAKDRLEPGESGMVQLRFQEPMVLFTGDSFVVRTGSPLMTAGGGRVLDTHPPAQRRRTEDAMALLTSLQEGNRDQACRQMVEQAKLSGMSSRLIAERVGLPFGDVHELLRPLLSGADAWLVFEGEAPVYLSADAVNSLNKHLFQVLNDYLIKNPHKEGIGKEELRSKLPRRTPPYFFPELLKRLQQQKGVFVDREQVFLASAEHRKTEQYAQDPLVKQIVAGGLEPPAVRDLVSGGLTEKIIRERLQDLVKKGQLQRVSSDLYYPTDIMKDLEARLTEYLMKQESITPVQFREMTGLSRKYMIPLLEFFDSQKLTIRIGDSRRLRKRPGS